MGCTGLGSVRGCVRACDKSVAARTSSVAQAETWRKVYRELRRCFPITSFNCPNAHPCICIEGISTVALCYRYRYSTPLYESSDNYCLKATAAGEAVILGLLRRSQSRRLFLDNHTVVRIRHQIINQSMDQSIDDRSIRSIDLFAESCGTA